MILLWGNLATTCTIHIFHWTFFPFLEHYVANLSERRLLLITLRGWMGFIYLFLFKEWHTAQICPQNVTTLKLLKMSKCHTIVTEFWSSITHVIFFREEKNYLKMKWKTRECILQQQRTNFLHKFIINIVSDRQMFRSVNCNYFLHFWQEKVDLWSFFMNKTNEKICKSSFWVKILVQNVFFLVWKNKRCS